jgi:hypothetical protein
MQCLCSEAGQRVTLRLFLPWFDPIPPALDLEKHRSPKLGQARYFFVRSRKLVERFRVALQQDCRLACVSAFAPLAVDQVVNPLAYVHHHGLSVSRLGR